MNFKARQFFSEYVSEVENKEVAKIEGEGTDLWAAVTENIWVEWETGEQERSCEQAEIGDQMLAFILI